MLRSPYTGSQLHKCSALDILPALHKPLASMAVRLVKTDKDQALDAQGQVTAVVVDCHYTSENAFVFSSGEGALTCLYSLL